MKQIDGQMLFDSETIRIKKINNFFFFSVNKKELKLFSSVPDSDVLFIMYSWEVTFFSSCIQLANPHKKKSYHSFAIGPKPMCADRGFKVVKVDSCSLS